MFKNLYKAVFIITLFSVLTRIIGFFIRIFMSRELGAEMIGIYQISVSICSVFMTLVNSGIPLTISRLSAEFKAKNNNLMANKVVTSGTILSFAIAVLICIFTIIFKPLIISLSHSTLVASVLLALLPALIGTSLNVGFKGYLWGKKKHFENCFVDFVEQIIKIILMIILVSREKTIEIAVINCAISISLACLLSNLLSMFFYFKNHGRLTKPKGAFKLVFKKSYPITLLRLVSSIGGMLISVIVPITLVKVGFSKEQALSLFGIALGMTLPLLYLPNTLVGSLATALVPDLAGLKAEGNMEEFSSKIKTSISFSVFISLLFVPCFISVGKEIGLFVYNNELSGIMLSYFAMMMLPMGINDISSSILNSMGYEIKSFINFMIGNVGLILCIILLPKLFGIYALGIGMGISLTISSILNIRSIKKHLKLDNIILKDMIKMCLFLIPSALINEFAYNLLIKVFGSFFSIAISSIFGVMFYVVLCLMFKIFTIEGLMINFKKIKLFNTKRKKNSV